MVLNQAKKLISFGLKALRLDDKETRAEVKKLVRAGAVEAKHAAGLTRAVINEANRERKVLMGFARKELAKEYRKARPEARRAAQRARAFAGKTVRAAKKISRRARKTAGAVKGRARSRTRRPAQNSSKR